MRKFFHGISLFAGIGLIVLIAAYVGVDETIAHLRTIRPIILLPVTITYCFAWYLRGYRFHRLMRIFERTVPLMRALYVEVAGNCANFLAPAKLGDIVKLVYLKKHYGLPYPQGTLAAVLIRVLDLVTVLALILATVAFMSRQAAQDYRVYIVVGIAVLALVFGAAAAFYFRPRLFHPLFIGPAARLLPTFEAMHRTFTANIGQFALILGISVLVWLFDSLVLQVFLWSFEINLGYAQIIFVLMVSNLVKTLPITPGGIGVLEGVLVGLLSAFGVDKSVAFTVSILDHGFKNIFTLVLGVLFLKHLGLTLEGAERLRETEGLKT